MKRYIVKAQALYTSVFLYLLAFYQVSRYFLSFLLSLDMIASVFLPNLAMFVIVFTKISDVFYRFTKFGEVF